MGEYRIKPSKVLQDEFSVLIVEIERLSDYLRNKTVFTSGEYQKYQRDLAHSKRLLHEIETKLYVQITKGEI